MKIRMFLVFSGSAVMVCLLILLFSTQRQGMMEASQATTILGRVSSTSAAKLTLSPHDSARPECASAISFTPTFTALLPIVVKNYPLFIWPIEGAPDPPYPVCDAFGPRDNAGVYDWHRGIDISGTECSTPVVASTSGHVPFSADYDDRYPNCGKIIQIQYPNMETSEYLTNYCHLCKRWVATCNDVDQGQSIGLVGTTPDTWPHLHFEIRQDYTTPHNPYCYLPHPDLDQHSIEISSVDAGSLPNSISITLRATSPRNELDINEASVHVYALDAGGIEVDSKYVNFNERHNCGTDDRCVMDGSTQICIYPQHFWCDTQTWEVSFTFSNLTASSLVQVLAEVKDCKGAAKQDSWSNVGYLPAGLKNSPLAITPCLDHRCR